MTVGIVIWNSNYGTRAMEDVPVKSLGKALGLLDILVFKDIEQQGIGLLDLAKQMNLRPNTTRNLLKTMIVHQYVAQNQQSKYIVGSKVQEIGRIKLLTPQSLRKHVFHPIMRKFVDKIHEYIIFTSLINGFRVPIADMQHGRAIIIDSARIPNRFFDMVTGRIHAAFATDAELKDIIRNHGYPRNCWDDIANTPSLAKALKAIRKRGYEIVRHVESDTVAIAVPVMSRKHVHGAVGTFMPTYRYRQAKSKTVLKELNIVATELCSAMEQLSKDTTTNTVKK